MADWFKFKDVLSTDLGIRVMQFPSTPLPAERISFEPALGRSGSLRIKEGEGVYDDVLLQLTVFMSDLSNLDAIGPWLRGDGILIMGNRPNEYYKGQSTNQIDISRIVRGDEHRLFPIMFRCHPYRYQYPAIAPITLVDGATITNPGNVYSQPIYRITGSGDIDVTIGEKTISVNDLDGAITIDIELGLAYQPGSDPLIPLTTKVSKDDWPFIIPPGEHTIDLGGTGTITSATVEPRWRDV